jgi:hypothetical protein
MGFEIEYPKSTKEVQKQWGRLKKRPKSYNDSKDLRRPTDSKPIERPKSSKHDKNLEVPTDRSPATTISLQDIDKDSAPRHPSKGDGGAAEADQTEQAAMPQSTDWVRKVRTEGLCIRYVKKFGVTPEIRRRVEELVARDLSDRQIWNMIDRSS